MMRLILAICGLLALAGCEAPAVKAPPRVADGRCTSEEPCRIRILFQYTQAGLAALQPHTEGARLRLQECYRRSGDYGFCQLNQVAKDNVEAARAAFLRSGITEVADGRPNIVFLPPDVPLTPTEGLDAHDTVRLDVGDGREDPTAMNSRLLDDLPSKPVLKRYAKDYSIVVVFTGLRSPDGCVVNSVQRRGYVLMPGCMAADYLASPEMARLEELLFLHELGHSFGAWHNDNARPQPCAKAPPDSAAACAWEACKDRRCDAAELAAAPDAFCTLVGQYNYGQSYCRAHTGGEDGGGWVREYSHPGKCRTRGFETYDCGDARHDAVSLMRARAWRVAHSSPV